MSWVGKPTKFAKDVQEDISEEIRTVAIKVLRNVVSDAPVDTGLFKGNWLVGISSKDPRVIKRKSISGQVSINTGIRKIGKQKGFEDIWISNNLPYAQRLNEGWSGQAPMNFVQNAIIRALR